MRFRRSRKHPFTLRVPSLEEGHRTRQQRNQARNEKLTILSHSLSLQSLAYNEMRRPIPIEAGRIPRMVELWRQKVNELPIPASANRRIQNQIDRLEKNAYPLSELRSTIMEEHLSAAGVLDQLLQAQVPTLQKKRMKPYFRMLAENPEQIRIAIDWTGPHFLVPRKLKPLLACAFNVQGGEAFGGLSEKIKPFSIRTASGKKRFTITAASFTVHSPDRIWMKQVERHEKWHDFEHVRGTIRDPQLKKIMRQKNPPFPQVRKLIEEWFHDEFSASMLQGENMIPRTRKFVGDFRQIYERINPHHPALRELEKLESELIEIQHEIQYLIGLKTIVPRSKAVAYLAAFISHTPVFRMRRRLDYLAKQLDATRHAEHEYATIH